jgi:DNA-binding XRE family transcriptional regulator
LYGKPVKITRGRVEPYYFVSIIINLYYLHLVGVTRMATKAKLVREMRLDKRLTQADVAAKMKISQASYSAIELGEKPRAVQEAVETINRMRTRTDRTDGGSDKTGRLK